MSAVFREVERRAPFGVFNIPHFCDRDTEIGGYHVPAGTQVFLTYGNIYRDPSIFKVRTSSARNESRINAFRHSQLRRIRKSSSLRDTSMMTPNMPPWAKSTCSAWEEGMLNSKLGFGI